MNLKRKLGLTTACVLVAAIGLTSGASAQTVGEPQQSTAPVVDVQQVNVPAGRGKLIRKGVLVQASCTPSCVLVVKLKVSSAVASKLGIGGEVVGSGVTATQGEGVPTFIRARIKRSLRDRLSSYSGGFHLQILVTALQ